MNTIALNQTNHGLKCTILDEYSNFIGFNLIPVSRLLDTSTGTDSYGHAIPCPELIQALVIKTLTINKFKGKHDLLLDKLHPIAGYDNEQVENLINEAASNYKKVV